VNSVKIDTLRVDDVSFDETVALVASWARDGSGGYVTTPNVDHVVRAHTDSEFRRAQMAARLRVPDGMGIVYGSRICGTPFRDTVTGRLLPDAIAQATRADPIPTALVGGPADGIETARRRLANAGADIVAAIAPPMGFAVGGDEDAALMSELHARKPRIIYVGLGSPKQELWMARHAAELPGAVMIGVGQAIDVLGGRVPAAPRWMTRVGLEWVFRMWHDPRRIGQRVFVGTPRFAFWMLRQRVRAQARAARAGRSN
jgi:N-acetylglucosaminyldiphosphoundecaprenol N-acetyl-beta-D-mannosaminyltransferase